MQVNLYASLRHKVGAKQVNVVAPANPTIIDVLIKLTESYPVLKDNIWSVDGSLVDHIHVLINGKTSGD